MKLAEVNIGEKFLGTNSKLAEVTAVGDLVTVVIRGAFAVAGIVLVVFLIMGGIGIISGAGSDNPEKLEKGKKSVTSAIIGFVVVFAAYWIVQLIEALTGTKLI